MQKPIVSKTVFLSIFGFFFCLAAPVFGETAIIPYKIINASEFFPVETGREYAKLVGIAGLASKTNLKIAPPPEIESALKGLNLNHQGTITLKGLSRFARGRRYDYILLGTLSKSKGGYISESVLYSAEENRVIRKIRKTADSLFRLARREAEDVFRAHREITESRTGGRLDAAFLIDLSYRISPDWPSVKEAVIGFASNTIDRLGMDVKIMGVPYSDRITFDRAFASVNSIVDVKNGLEKMRPQGGPSAENFSKSINYALTSTIWRPDSEKILIIIANSDPGRVSLLERYGALARKNGIKIYSVCLGSLTGDKKEHLRTLASIGRGQIHDASYHQKVFDAQANEIDLFMENGRLFRGRYFSREWTAGLFPSKGSRRPRDYLEEVIVSASRGRLDPYNMAEQYDRLSRDRVLNKNELENNIPQIIKRITGAHYKKGNRAARLPVARVLLSDGQVSVWTTVTDPESAAFFREKAARGSSFPLGVTITRDEKQAYGLAFHARLKGLGPEYVPIQLMVGLGDLIKKSDRYMSNGLLSPPVWFITVRVEEFKKLKAARDVRSR